MSELFKVMIRLPVFLAAIVLAPSISTAQHNGYLDTCRDKTAPSNNTLCGVKGHVKLELSFYYAASSGTIVNSKEKCASLCARRVGAQPHEDISAPWDFGPSYCRSFQWDSSTGFCQLAREQVSTCLVQDSKADSVFYDSECFDCGTLCPQPLGVNLLDNGDFEQPLLGPWGSMNGTTAPGHNSNTSYRCRGPRNRKMHEHDCFLAQAFNICPGLYAIKFDYKIRPPLGEKGTALYLETGSIYSSGQLAQFSWSVNVTRGDSEVWRTVLGFFRRETTTKPFLYPTFSFGDLYSDDSSTESRNIFVDNVSVRRIPDPPPTKHGAVSVINNGGFEEGRIAPWKFKTPDDSLPPPTVVEPGISSKYALKINPTPNFRPISMSQVVQTKGNTSYLFAFQFRPRKDSEHFQHFNLEVIGEQMGDYRLYYIQKLSSPRVPKNKFVSIPVSVFGGRTQITLTFSGTFGGIFYPLLVDNFEMVALAESYYS